MGIILKPFAMLLMFLYEFFNSYGIALILFGFIVKLVLFPVTLKSKKSMIQMNMLSGKMNKLKAQYGKDPQRYNMEVQKLYEKENVNPMGGCLPLLIQMPILFAMFAVMRHIAGEQAVAMYETAAAGAAYVPEGFLWITNIWQPDNIMANIIPSLSELAGNLAVVKNSTILTEETVALVKNNYEIVMKPLMEQYNTGVANGWAILPILAGASQYFTTWLMNGNKKGQPQTAQSQQNKMMNYMFPLMSVFFCWQYNAAFSIYWVTSNLYTIVTYIAFNLYFDRKAKKAEKA